RCKLGCMDHVIGWFPDLTLFHCCSAKGLWRKAVGKHYSCIIPNLRFALYSLALPVHSFLHNDLYDARKIVERVSTRSRSRFDESELRAPVALTALFCSVRVFRFGRAKAFRNQLFALHAMRY